MPKGLPVGLVGESNYQPAIRACSVGEKVYLLKETGNPYDPKAVTVLCARGQQIGYIPRDSFLQRAIHSEKKGVAATILKINGGDRGGLGVVIDTVFVDEPLGERTYSR